MGYNPYVYSVVEPSRWFPIIMNEWMNGTILSKFQNTATQGLPLLYTAVYLIIHLEKIHTNIL